MPGFAARRWWPQKSRSTGWGRPGRAGMVAAATGLAELPGVDPEKDIDVTVSGGVLTIKAEKHEAMEGKHRS